MREVLRRRLRDCPVRVRRSEVEALRAEAARLFDRLKGVSSRGHYVRTDDGWISAWVREVS